MCPNDHAALTGSVAREIESYSVRLVARLVCFASEITFSPIHTDMEYTNAINSTIFNLIICATSVDFSRSHTESGVQNSFLDSY